MPMKINFSHATKWRLREGDKEIGETEICDDSEASLLANIGSEKRRSIHDWRYLTSSSLFLLPLQILTHHWFWAPVTKRAAAVKTVYEQNSRKKSLAKPGNGLRPKFHLTMWGWRYFCSCWRTATSLRIWTGIPLDLCLNRIIFRATVSPVSLSCALYTVPKLPEIRWMRI